MPSCFITKRKRKTGVRYVVRYRLGGREARLLHGGSFRTNREARARRDWIAGELAAMRVPDLKALSAAATQGTLAEAAQDWIAGRHDLGASAKRDYEREHRRLKATGLGQMLPAAVSSRSTPGSGR